MLNVQTSKQLVFSNKFKIKKIFFIVLSITAIPEKENIE